MTPFRLSLVLAAAGLSLVAGGGVARAQLVPRQPDIGPVKPIQLPKPTLQQSTPAPTPTPTPAGPPARPSRTALIVILENGGLLNNLDPGLRSALNVTVPFARCGQFDLAMKSNEDIGAFLVRVGGQIASNAQCLNPFAWRIVNVRLSDWADEQTDQMLQNTVLGANSILATQTRYDTVVVMQNADATPERVLARMRQLAPTHVMDVHVLTHGGTDFFVGYRGAQFHETSFFRPLRAEQEANRPMFIRTVYQMNCKSGSLIDDWERLHVEAVNGTFLPNSLNSMPWQYFHFMGNWIKDRDSFGVSTDTAANEAELYTKPMYILVGKFHLIGQSKLVVSPNSNRGIRVN